MTLLMGRGAKAKVRWKNDRIRKKRDRDKRQAEAARDARQAGAPTPSTTAPSS
jgi:hypothetical protein